jgi:uncharacterized protein YceH (UPF0502 family)
MDLLLEDTEVRVLGCLLEKEMATPEYYPLSLNALLNACNQKTNRHPVLSLEDHDVARAVEGLKEKKLVLQSDVSRVPKYEHHLQRHFDLERGEAAILCLLLLRGPQTPGELRGRSDRLFNFETADEVADTLQNLQELSLVRKMARQPGQKECRYTHLLAGEPIEDDGAVNPARVEPAMAAVREENQRLATLEKELADLRQDFDALRQAFLDFKHQFD